MDRDSGHSPPSRCSRRLQGLWRLLSHQLYWDQPWASDTTRREVASVGAGGCWAPLMATSRKRRQIPEQRWGKRRVAGTREPHPEISDLPPSLSYFVNVLCIWISGAYKHRHKAVCFSNLKTGNLPPLTFYKWRINGRLFILKFWNSQPQHWWLTNG